MLGLERIGNYEVQKRGDGTYSFRTTVPGHVGAGILLNEQQLEDFRAKHSLERVPNKDEVVFNNKKDNVDTNKVELSMDNIKNEVYNYKYNVDADDFYRATNMTSESGLDVVITNGFLGLSDRKIKGQYGDTEIDLKLGDNMLNHFKGTLKGKFGDKEFDLKYKMSDKKDKIVIKGKGLDADDEAMNNLLSVFILGNVIHNSQRDN